MRNPDAGREAASQDNTDPKDGNTDLVPLSSSSGLEQNDEPLLGREDDALEDAIMPGPKPRTASWGDLPRKDQLLVITLARLSEPLVQSSIQSYMFYQLKWFDPTLPDSVISSQAGILQYALSLYPCGHAHSSDIEQSRSASFTAAQFLTAMMWGRIADSSLCGRKTVLMIGLAGTCEYWDQSLFWSLQQLIPPFPSPVMYWLCLLDLVLAGPGVPVAWGYHERKCGRAEDHVSLAPGPSRRLRLGTLTNMNQTGSARQSRRRSASSAPETRPLFSSHTGPCLRP